MKEEREILLLTKLLTLLKAKYKDDNSEAEKRFNNACDDLMSNGDITKSLYVQFCVDNDIEPIKLTTKTRLGSSTSTSSYYDPCTRSSSLGRGC
jgi:hypothetical protein